MTIQHQHAEILQNRFGLRVAAHLSAAANELPHDISERLRIARQQAVARRKQPVATARLRPATVAGHNGAGTSTLSFGDDDLGFWGRLVSGLVVLAMVVGLIAINVLQDDDRTMEVADLDAALLTGDLPPEAYADPGFMQYLQTSGKGKASSTTGR